MLDRDGHAVVKDRQGDGGGRAGEGVLCLVRLDLGGGLDRLPVVEQPAQDEALAHLRELAGVVAHLEVLANLFQFVSGLVEGEQADRDGSQVLADLGRAGDEGVGLDLGLAPGKGVVRFEQRLVARRV